MNMVNKLTNNFLIFFIIFKVLKLIIFIGIKLIRKFLGKLPTCLRELTGSKYVCPRYWILERAKKVKLWNKVGWVLCAKEVKARIDKLIRKYSLK